jgi:hypothetical protein
MSFWGHYIGRGAMVPATPLASSFVLDIRRLFAIVLGLLDQ